MNWEDFPTPASQADLEIGMHLKHWALSTGELLGSEANSRLLNYKM